MFAPATPYIININGTDSNLVWVCKEEGGKRHKYLHLLFTICV